MNRQATVKTGERNGHSATPDSPPLPVSDPVLKDLKKLFRLLADESRLRIVLALAREGRLHVSDLRKVLGSQSQPAVSHHLTLMRTLGLVDYTRTGRHNYYHLAPGYIRTLLERIVGDGDNSTRSLQLADFTVSLQRT